MRDLERRQAFGDDGRLVEVKIARTA